MPLLQAGDLAPEVSGVAHTGDSWTLSDQRGSFVVLWFYPKADTPG